MVNICCLFSVLAHIPWGRSEAFWNGGVSSSGTVVRCDDLIAALFPHFRTVLVDHGLELVFGDPIFVTCPSGFHDPVLRPPSPDELLKVTRQLGEKPPIVVAFEADAGGQEPVCLIAAERLSIVQETVLRYWREDAGPGQRFAPWVSSSGQ
ncbi:hypothetical protein ACIQZO_09220 [Streptomyces sp. NPDC097617]|uniref:hypothetical protein n=1 Tax=Streptomyces sp. NPDC097617 TaxID=3366091 RepID=UPI003830449D